MSSVGTEHTFSPAESGHWQALVTGRALWIVLPALIALLLYVSTAQLHINSSNHPYATDVGEIQNALPRWGTIHHSGYPLYTALGSAFVTGLRWIGIAPAAGASLFSAVFGALTIGLIAAFALEIGISGPSAALGALAVAVSTSIWVDASLAEVHTMTLALSVATLLFAVRFGRNGRTGDLYLLALFFTQAVAHQRSTILLAPAVLLLLWPHWRETLRHVPALLLITLLAPLTYLYLPLRVWMGADWVFGAPGTWEGFWILFFDNRADRVFDVQNSMAAWLERLQTTTGILADDLLWPLLLLGLLALLLMIGDKKRWRAGLALTFVWMLNFALTVLIWRNRVVDAQLAAKLPVLIAAGIGLAYLLDRLRGRSPQWGAVAGVALAAVLLFWGWQARAFTLTITRDDSVEPLIATLDRVEPFGDGRRTTLTMPWGRDYWAAAYAQTYRGQLDGLTLVDHNANPRALIARGDHLLAPLATFYVFPVAWWEEQLGGRLYLGTAAPEVVEMHPEPLVRPQDVPAAVALDLENGIRLRDVRAAWRNERQILVTVYWEALAPIAHDYSVAVHLVAQDPPAGPDDLLDQADNNHPVEGYYPTTQWQPGEIVRDHYLLTVPPGSNPVAVRVGMYRSDPEAGFLNTPWYSLPLSAVSRALR